MVVDMPAKSPLFTLMKPINKNEKILEKGVRSSS